MNKRSIYLFLLLLLITLFYTSCTKKAEYIYQYSTINPLVNDEEYIADSVAFRSMFATPDFTMGLSIRSSMKEYTFRLFPQTDAGSDDLIIKSVNLNKKQIAGIYRVLPMTDGGYAVFLAESDPDIQKTRDLLVKYSKDGTVIFTLDITDIIIEIALCDMEVSSSGTIYILYDSIVHTISNDGQVLFTLDLPDDRLEKIGFNSYLERDSNSNIYLCYYTRTESGAGYRFRQINEALQAYDPIADIPDVGEYNSP